MTKTERAHVPQISFALSFLSGGFAGLISKTIAAPIERVKLLLQTQTANKKVTRHYQGITDCFLRTYHEEGVASFWRGNGVNILRYFPTQALNFSFKESLGSRLITCKKDKDPLRFFAQNILSGGLAGSMTTFMVYPLDFARTRLGVDIGRRPHEREFKGLLDCMKRILVSDGLKGLYQGFAPALVGIFIYRGLYFGMYDTGKAVLFEGKDVPIWTKFVFAQFVVISSETFAYPTDTVKRRLMMQSGRVGKQYSGWFDCTVKIAQREGIGAFFTGNLTNVYRSFGSSLCLVLYDVFRKAAEDHAGKFAKAF